MASKRDDNPRAEDDLLRAAITELLTTVPETWTDIDHSKLSAVQQRALFLMVAAELVECRCDFEVQLANDDSTFAATLAASGEHGIVEALEPLVAKARHEWLAAWKEWRAKHGEKSQAFCATGRIVAWRLTECGLIARRDAQAGVDSGLRFVLRLPPFIDRPAVRGYGSLLHFEKRGNEPKGPQEVKVTNWGDGTDAFSTAFNALFEKMARQATDTTAEQGGKSAPLEPLPAADDADLEILRFLSRRPTYYHEIGKISLDDGPTDRKVISKRLKDMSKHGMVDLTTKGVRILPRGELVLSLGVEKPEQNA